MNNKWFFWGSCLLFAFLAPQAHAGNAGLLLSPTRVVLENGSRYIAVTVRNTGDATGRYKIDIIDAAMNEAGGIKLQEDGTREPFSAADLLSYSPSNLTLKPNESQVVRLLVKNKESLPDGEYRSHMLVKMTESDLDESGQSTVTGTGIAIKAKISTVIPVIVRRGETSYAVSISDARLVSGGGNGKDAPEVKIELAFSGNRSVLGDVKLTHISADGKETQVAFMRGIAIYRDVAKRTQTLPMNVPEGLDVHSGHIRINFLSQEDEGGHVLAEKIITN